MVRVSKVWTEKNSTPPEIILFIMSYVLPWPGQNVWHFFPSKPYKGNFGNVENRGGENLEHMWRYFTPKTYQYTDRPDTDKNLQYCALYYKVMNNFLKTWRFFNIYFPIFINIKVFILWIWYITILGTPHGRENYINSFYFEKEHKIYFLIKLFTVSCYTILLWWAILEFYWYPGQF